MSLQRLSEDLHARRQAVLEMGGVTAIDRQHASGKLTARERVALLVDPDSFRETGLFAHHQNRVPDLAGKSTPADGVITGVGTIAGRSVCVVAYDFTVMAGCMGEIGEQKIADLRHRAVTSRMPFIWLLDSAGARIQEVFGAQFAGSGGLFYDQSRMSGQVPLICAVMGPCAAGTAYIPGLADVVFMVEKTGSMALAGPHLVKAAIGEEISAEALGGSNVHCTQSGVADASFLDDAACIDAIKTYLSFFPSSSDDRPPFAATIDPRRDCGEAIYETLPETARQPYDMHAIIASLVDHGRFFDIKRDFARNIICGFAHLAGHPVGIVANQPSVLGGTIDNDASDKAAHFINLCDAFHVPLIFLVDTPGFMVGAQVERVGIIRHGAKFIYHVANATVPKLTLIVRKAYGAGYYAMCGKAFGSDLIVAWPTAEVSVMGAEGALNIIYRKYVDAAPYPEQVREEALRQLREKISPYLTASAGFLDDIIDPRESRAVLIDALHSLSKKTVPAIRRKCGIAPV